MKRILFLLTLISVFSCKTESDVEPAKENTFMRYIGTEFNHVAVLAAEDNNGFSLLATKEIETNVAGQIRYKIQFVRLDLYGNKVWEQSYPNTQTYQDQDWTASSFIPTYVNSNPTGYLIVGDRINADGTRDLLLLQIDLNGTVQGNPHTISLGAPKSLQGHAVTSDGSDFIVLGSIKNNGSQDMFVAKVLGSDLDSCRWKREYGDAESTLINRIFLKNNQNIWGGSVFFNSTYDVRLIRVNQDTQPSDIGNPIGSTIFNENAMDFCPATGGWVVTGYTNQGNPADPNDINPQQTEDIYVMKVSDDSRIIFNTQLKGVPGKNDQGVSVTSTSDQAYIVLGTVGTEFKQEDLYVTRINDSGVQEWSYNYGGSDKQDAASVRETSDGGLLVFGTTYFGNEKKLMLLKLDKNGKL